MNLIILGAGATRGASFVDINENPCLPPLDNDFFTQLQRIQNKKHMDTISFVIEKSVEIFGKNFQLTLENVFSTIENVLDILKMSGKKSDFTTEELSKLKETFLQALAAVFEESLTEQLTLKSKSTLQPKKCEYHVKLMNFLKPRDCIISFNYDCLIDHTLKEFSKGIWNPQFGYGFRLRGDGARLNGHEFWSPSDPSDSDNTINLYKLHGSLHFKFNDNVITLKKRPYTRQLGKLKFDIIPPETNKELAKKPYMELWRKAGESIYKAETLVFVGYSFPKTDLHSSSLFQVSINPRKLKKIIIVNPDKNARYRTREILTRAITGKTLIQVFDSFGDFIGSKIQI